MSVSVSTCHEVVLSLNLKLPCLFLIRYPKASMWPITWEVRQTCFDLNNLSMLRKQADLLCSWMVSLVGFVPSSLYFYHYILMWVIHLIMCAHGISQYLHLEQAIHSRKTLHKSWNLGVANDLFPSNFLHIQLQQTFMIK